jgi:hypothetical protein
MQTGSSLSGLLSQTAAALQQATSIIAPAASSFRSARQWRYYLIHIEHRAPFAL